MKIDMANGTQRKHQMDIAYIPGAQKRRDPN